MLPSAWNAANQHWISQFLLRGFGTKRRRSEVYRLDRSDGSLSCERVERVASRSFLMTELDDQVLRVIEDRASQTVSLLRKSRFGLFAEADRRALDLLVLSLVFNHPSWIPEKERIRHEVVWERGLDVMWAHPIYGTAVLADAVMSAVDGAAGRNYFHGVITSRSSSSVEHMRAMRLTAYVPPLGHSFVIGDQPVVTLRPDLSAPRRWLYGDEMVVLPISHDVLLVYDRPAPPNLLSFGGPVSNGFFGMMDEIYRSGSAGRYVYGRTPGSLTRVL